MTGLTKISCTLGCLLETSAWILTIRQSLNSNRLSLTRGSRLCYLLPLITVICRRDSSSCRKMNRTPMRTTTCSPPSKDGAWLWSQPSAHGNSPTFQSCSSAGSQPLKYSKMLMMASKIPVSQPLPLRKARQRWFQSIKTRQYSFRKKTRVESHRVRRQIAIQSWKRLSRRSQKGSWQCHLKSQIESWMWVHLHPRPRPSNRTTLLPLVPKSLPRWKRRRCQT